MHQVRQIAKCRLNDRKGERLSEAEVKPIGSLCVVGAEFRSTFAQMTASQRSGVASADATATATAYVASTLLDAMQIAEQVEAQEEAAAAAANHQNDTEMMAEVEVDVEEVIEIDEEAGAESMLDVSKIFPSIVWSNVLPGGGITVYT